MRAACYKRVTPEQLALRYKEFGGIPRFLFRKVVILHEQDMTLDEIRDYQKAAQEDILGNPKRIDNLESSDPFKSLWTIYHTEPITTADGATNYTRYDSSML